MGRHVRTLVQVIQEQAILEPVIQGQVILEQVIQGQAILEQVILKQVILELAVLQPPIPPPDPSKELVRAGMPLRLRVGRIYPLSEMRSL